MEITLEGHEVSCRGGEIVLATHFPAATPCRNLVRTRGFVTSHLCPDFVSSHANPCDLTLLPRSQVHRTRRATTFQSCACELMDVQSRCQQFLGTLRECFQLVSERAWEKAVVGRQAIAHVVSCDTAESSPLTSSWHLFQSSDTSYPIDADSSLTSVHGQEVVDPLKPAQVREERSIADPCLGRHSSFGSCEHDRPTWEK